LSVLTQLKKSRRAAQAEVTQAMATTHIVKQGEHISRIAAQNGFLDYHTVWDDPQNAELSKKRNPNVLFPGDQVFIPDKEVKTEASPTGRRHRFKLSMRPLKLRIVVQNYDRTPIAGTACSLEVEGNTKSLTTNAKGLIDEPIPATAEMAKLTIRNDEFSIRIGHLDPVEENSGLEARLNNLGYYVAPEDKRDKDELRSAIEEFQRDYGMVPPGGKPSGVADAATLAKLKAVHGC
jgi:hypothetical protein